MHVRIKGLNWTNKRLADGRVVRHYYAYRGGPRLPGKPGSQEFMDAYNEAIKARIKAAPGTLQHLFDAYQRSSEWDRLGERTRLDYAKLFRVLEPLFGDFPVTALDDRRTRGLMLAERDRLAKGKSGRQADYAFTVLARALAWAKGRGLIETNPLTAIGRIYRASRADKVWTPDDEARFMAAAPEHLHLVFLLAVWTGQRQGDLLRLTWPQYDGAVIRLKQGKTGVRVVVPVGAPLKAALDARRDGQKLGRILLTSAGTPWTAGGFQASWRKAVQRAGVTGLTFHDLRGTAVHRLALAGATEAEIATLTGHSMQQVRSVLDASYLHRDPKLAESAVRKRERHEAETKAESTATNEGEKPESGTGFQTGHQTGAIRLRKGKQKTQ
ncbi:MAG: tyrosine-type recombinase/integrase [Rhizobiaceae bacterium]|nr:tyrosine-type recombinase/integrase [Rhizobiaceae bacterium]